MSYRWVQKELLLREILPDVPSVAKRNGRIEAQYERSKRVQKLIDDGKKRRDIAVNKLSVEVV
jgi:hypothetical protein